MDNSIRNTNQAQSQIDLLRTSKQQAEQQKATSKEVGVKDEVEIERSQNMMKVLKERIDATSEVDIEKVNRIKEQLANGNYAIDSKSIANKLAQFETALIKQE